MLLQSRLVRLYVTIFLVSSTSCSSHAQDDSSPKPTEAGRQLAIEHQRIMEGRSAIRSSELVLHYWTAPTKHQPLQRSTSYVVFDYPYQRYFQYSLAFGSSGESIYVSYAFYKDDQVIELKVGAEQATKRKALFTQFLKDDFRLRPEWLGVGIGEVQGDKNLPLPDTSLDFTDDAKSIESGHGLSIMQSDVLDDESVLYSATHSDASESRFVLTPDRGFFKELLQDGRNVKPLSRGLLHRKIDSTKIKGIDVPSMIILHNVAQETTIDAKNDEPKHRYTVCECEWLQFNERNLVWPEVESVIETNDVSKLPIKPRKKISDTTVPFVDLDILGPT
jgi:hypothetical protein